MIPAKNYSQEKERLVDLASYSILDTLPESDFDNIVTIAAEICGTPISLISLIDDKRQWFKAHHGLDVSQTDKEYAFCAHAINTPKDAFIIQDARRDERFHDNPLVIGDPHVIFYVGIPLISPEGMPLGTLCVIDHKPNLLSKSQLNSLAALSKQVMNLLELRRNKLYLDTALMELEEKNLELERFAIIAAHDLKSPLINITGMSELFAEEYGSKINGEGKEMLTLITKSADQLKRMIDGLLEYSRSERVLHEAKTWVSLQNLVEDISGLFTFDNDLKISLASELKKIHANRTAIDQILINLIANAIKYSDKEPIEITIGVADNATHYEIFVQDNGPGIAAEHQEKIFRLFEILVCEDKFGLRGNGIGLATVKKIVEKSGGVINVVSTIGQGAKFIFSIEK